jgi:putative FmdB family regulatory protein
MPLYEYGCRGCGHRFEDIRKADDRLRASACPACGGEETSLRLSAPGFVGAATGAAAASCATQAGGCCGGYCPN